MRVKTGGAARFLGVTVAGGAMLAGLLTPLAGVALQAADAGQAAAVEHFPSDFLDPDVPQRSTVLAADGSVLATFFRQDRIAVPLDQIAPVLREAVLATEDARFYAHGAIDVKGTVRALAANVLAGRVVQGGSTITQQYVKQLLVLKAQSRAEVAEATDTTVGRKVRELAFALQAEERMSKDEILESYLNVAYFGNGAYGIEVAAQRYFGTRAAQLTLPQAALLAGLLQAPSTYDPVRRPARATSRRAEVLTRMADAGFLRRSEARRVSRQPLNLDLQPVRNGCQDSSAPFFCSYVLAEVRRTPSLGSDAEERMARLHEGGLTIRTSLDPTVQRGAERAMRRQIGSTHSLGSAAVITEPGTGAVRAIALNRKWGTGRGRTTLNYALDKDQGGSAGFQGGSTFKPFVLAAAARKDLAPTLRLDASSSATVDGFRNCKTDKKFPPYELGNYQSTGYGRISMAAATEMSVNTYFVRLQEMTGQCAPARIAESMGLRRADGEPLSRVPSFVLGVDEISPLRLAEAYATFGAGGIHCDSHAINAITGPDGSALTPPQADCRRVLGAREARQVSLLLRDVISGDNPRRTAARMDIGRPAAGKTGTTNRASAVWFAGFTRDYAAAVWAGYPHRSRPLRNITVNGVFYRQLFGGALPGPIWRDAMRTAHRGVPERGLR
ncbi:MAG: transglycosylase domain-containing protein [Sporichthyaceae bacterium]